MLEGRTYVPLLHARLAEMRALRELPQGSKSVIVPIVKLRPWLNSKSLERAFEVIEEAVGAGLYGLDLDGTKFEAEPDPSRPARAEFSRLFDPAGAFRNYYDAVEAGPNRVPVMRNVASGNVQIVGQLDHVERIDRGLFVRISPAAPGSVFDICEQIVARGVSNSVVVFDCGWGRDILNQAALCVPLIERILDISEDFEIVVAGSSFPDSFTGLGDRFEIEARERTLFQEVRRALNRGTLVYGDWGSTRPPTDPVPMMNIPRIDTARPLSWVSWRSEDGETYQDIAARVVDDPLWDGSLGLWGEYMIESTVAGGDGAIKSPAMAAAVRVNLHLHQQANSENPGGLIVRDEPVGDDL